ncbi:MAG TPA: hypothetical protein VKF38_04555 [Anaerolineaceae bacterium]|nr:hypothetical protein [Anaerolineaceae bacterium]
MSTASSNNSFWKKNYPDQFGDWTVPIVLLGLAVLCYGIFIPWFGLYGDDWPYLYVYHLLGSGGYVNFVAADRPLSAWVYVLISSLLGENIWAYHVLLLTLRWLGAVLLWRILLQLWPDARKQVATVACLFLVYPGFQQQPLPLEFVLHFAVFDLFFVSLLAMIASVKKSRRYWPLTILAVVCSASMFSLEYFIGLELIRPVLLWFSVSWQSETLSKKIKRIFLLWLPYLIILTGFVFWRVFIYKFQFYQPNLVNRFSQGILPGLGFLIVRILTDLKTTAWDAWRQIFVIPSDLLNNGSFLALVLGIFVAIALYLAFFPKSMHNENAQMSITSTKPYWKEWWFGAVMLGLFTLLIAGWPFWVTDISVNLSFPWDRATIPFMLGASLLLAGLVMVIFQPGMQGLVLAGIIGLSAGAHYQNALVYRNEWKTLQTYFWQISWRAPELKPGTILVSDQIPLFRYSDNDLTAPLNWMYDPSNHSDRLNYTFFDLSVRVWGQAGFPQLKENQTVQHDLRSLKFEGNSSDMLVIYYNPPACLRFLSKYEPLPPGLPASLVKSTKISHIDQVLDDGSNSPARPPVAFGLDPQPDWCYYFEKADLAYQQNDWQKIVNLGDQAAKNGLKPIEVSEYLPFIEGYARLGRWDEAGKLTQAAWESANVQPSVCSTWSRIQQSLVSGSPDRARAKNIQSELGCTS